MNDVIIWSSCCWISNIWIEVKWGLSCGPTSKSWGNEQTNNKHSINVSFHQPTTKKKSEIFVSGRNLTYALVHYSSPLFFAKILLHVKGHWKIKMFSRPLCNFCKSFQMSNYVQVLVAHRSKPNLVSRNAWRNCAEYFDWLFEPVFRFGRVSVDVFMCVFLCDRGYDLLALCH